MCGVIGAANFKSKAATPVNDFVINQFEDQHSRGTQGFGIVFVEPSGKYEVKRACEPAKAIIDLYSKPASIIMFHHRMPTSTKNKMSQTHPIVVDDGSLVHKYLVIHNGVCYNSQEMKKEHEDLGFNYTTLLPEGPTSTGYYRQNFNDSESVAIELARFAEKQTNEIKAEGYAAVIALQIDKTTDKVINMLFYRTLSAELHMSMKQGQLRLASEGIGEAITDETLYSWNIEDGKITKRKIEFYEKPKPPIKTDIVPSKKWGKHGKRHMFDNSLDDDENEYYQGYGYPGYIGTKHIGVHKKETGVSSITDKIDIENLSLVPFEGQTPDIDQAYDAFTSELEDIIEEINNDAIDKSLVFSIRVRDYEDRFKRAIRLFKKEACWWHTTPEKDRTPMGEYTPDPDEREIEDPEYIPEPPDDEERAIIGFNPHPEEGTKVETNKDQGVLKV